MSTHLVLALLLVAICLGASGQVLIKVGLTRLGAGASPLTVVLSLFSNAYVAGGFACYALSSVLYLLAVHRLALSYAYPMVALSYVVVALLAWRLLDERLPALRIAGLAVIMLGVVIMALSYREDRPPHGAAATPAAIQGDTSGRTGR